MAGVCSPGWHNLTLPRQNFPTIPRKKKVNYNPCQNFGINPGSKHIPCHTVGSENNILPRQKLWKTYPWGRHIPSTQSIARGPPLPPGFGVPTCSEIPHSLAWARKVPRYHGVPREGTVRVLACRTVNHQEETYALGPSFRHKELDGGCI